MFFPSCSSRYNPRARVSSSFGPRPDYKKEATRSSRVKRNPPVPSAADRPLHGLKTSKNFIVSNAVENILAEPKASSAQQGRYVDKADYGKRPAYLDAVNAEIEAERQELTELYEEKLIMRDEVQETQMGDAERAALLRQLKAKWAHINKQYINIVSVESRGQKRKKESYEDQMDKLEGYIKLLSNPRVVVSD